MTSWIFFYDFSFIIILCMFVNLFLLSNLKKEFIMFWNKKSVVRFFFGIMDFVGVSRHFGDASWIFWIALQISSKILKNSEYLNKFSNFISLGFKTFEKSQKPSDIFKILYTSHRLTQINRKFVKFQRFFIILLKISLQ